MSDEAEIRALIERWAEAVHSGNMDDVLAGHADDIVMFDVAPPEHGVRGIQAYRETWPPFFEWQRQGAAFEMVSLKVTAGADVAFAHALLRCRTAEEFKQSRDNRLRLTIGLRKEGGRWGESTPRVRLARRAARSISRAKFPPATKSRSCKTQE
jgi:uncharacterized protein (TIGR02246 family)